MTPTVADAIALLEELADDGTAPAQAVARLAALRAQHPDAVIELVWEEEPFTGSVHYDAIVDAGDGRTISLSVAGGPALPWPLRGAVRASERDLIKVNDMVLKVDQALTCLDAMWDEPALLRRLIDTCLIHEALARQPVELDPAEVQRAVDAFRRGKGLLSAGATEAWLAERGLAQDALVQLAVDQARLARLRARVIGDKVETWWAAHAGEQATATVAWVAMVSEAAAQRAVGGAASMVHLIVAAHRDGRAGGIECWPGSEFPGELLDDQIGKMSGPVMVHGHCWAVVQLLEVHPARLDARTRRAVEDHLWNEWLTSRRREARVEWLWGSAGRTAAA